MTYPFHPFGQFHALVSIYARDGTVAIIHGGIEMGQGIHTKVMKAVYSLVLWSTRLPGSYYQLGIKRIEDNPL